jgi:hypothetical protein
MDSRNRSSLSIYILKSFIFSNFNQIIWINYDIKIININKYFILNSIFDIRDNKDIILWNYIFHNYKIEMKKNQWKILYYILRFNYIIFNLDKNKIDYDIKDSRFKIKLK